MKTLTTSEAEAFYDRFGKKQDAQSFYETRALDELIAHSNFGAAKSLFEFGCGTGRIASILLREHLPPDAHYTGVDVSSTMIGLAAQRLRPFGGRAEVMKSAGEIAFPLADASVDRVFSSYVLDLLPEDGIERFAQESRRVLRGGGCVCLTGLGIGGNVLARAVTSGWRLLHRLSPRIVGGCRPLDLTRFFSAGWTITHHDVVASFGIASEILVARPA